MTCFCILLATSPNLLTRFLKQPYAATTELYLGMKVSLFCTHCRASYRPFTLVIRSSNFSAAPGAAVVSAIAGMGWDWAPGRQKRLTGMLLGWTKGLIVIHESVGAAAPGLGAAAGELGRVRQSGFKMRGMIQSAHIDIPGRAQSVEWLLYECLFCTRCVRSIHQKKN